VIGAVIFVIFFLAFLTVTLGMPTLPPGNMIHDLLNIPVTDYPVLGIPAWLLINAIVNGVTIPVLKESNPSYHFFVSHSSAK